MLKVTNPRVGDVRPSQLMYTYGIGAIIDLPKISVIVTGLEDWPVDPTYMHPIIEDRLLQAVRYKLPDVQKMLSAPIVQDTGLPPDPFDLISHIGVPVATFPRWMVCPQCHLLAPLKSGLFELDVSLFHPDRTVYKHTSCNKGHNPEVIPARVMAACENGHLDDFPWVDFAHRGRPCENPILRLSEYGPGGEARDLEVRCDGCHVPGRRLSDAFGVENRDKIPPCRGRRPHLRDFDPRGCELKMRPIVLGASNTWFPLALSTIAIPASSDRLAQLVDEMWATLQNVVNLTIIQFLRSNGQLGGLSLYSDQEIWQAIETHKQQDAGSIPAPAGIPDLKAPEWKVLTNYDPALNNIDFQLKPIDPPPAYSGWIPQVVLVERLREVDAMVGFTRIDSVGELNDPDLEEFTKPAPLSRQSPTWVPASEVRGEGVFIQFKETKIRDWLEKQEVKERSNLFFEAHKRWRKSRHIEPFEEGFPGMRYVFLHSFSHALMRQLSLECGYAAASLRERIYARPETNLYPAMAGILIYTSAPDSEGTLGGLVSLGETETLGIHIDQALESARLCANDPLCAEHPPSQQGHTIHAAACHACLFAPETSCERGNRYLDRSALVKTIEYDQISFFQGEV